MATSTGTASCATDLLKKLNTFLTANGWTRLRGETDIACASPKAARYWRILVVETQRPSTDFRSLKQVQLRTTAGGANVATTGASWSCSNVATGAAANLVGGTTVRSADVGNGIWWVTYDFGSDAVVREAVLTAGDSDEAPGAFLVQWSHDAKTWTTMASYSAGGYFAADNASATFTWDSGAGFTSPQHVSGTVARRRGHSFWPDAADTSAPFTDALSRTSEWCDDIWCWQGPGYDAARRTYVSMMSGYDLNSSDEIIVCGASTGVNLSVKESDWFNGQEGAKTDNINPSLIFGSGTCTYWFYVNSHRVVVVVKTGVDDYSSIYAGFLAAFAQPDDYPFPIYVGAMTNRWTSASSSDTNSGYRDMHDPGWLGAAFRDWNGNWVNVNNHDRDSISDDNWTSTSSAWIWPLHVGVADRAAWPFSVVGDHTNSAAHYLSRVDPTEQGDLPVIPCILQHDPYGNIGALDGVFVVPGGGVLAPEATFSISGTTYRVFSTRDKAAGNNYYAIRED